MISGAFVASGCKPSLQVRKSGYNLCGRRRVTVVSCGQDGTKQSRMTDGFSGRVGEGSMIVTETGGRGFLRRNKGDGRRRTTYRFDSGGGFERREVAESYDGEEVERENVGTGKTGLLERLVEPLLPINWERCTPSTYVNWVYWRIGRHIFRKAYFVLGTTSLLRSLGLGSNESLAISASLKWVLKDGVAMGTRIVVNTNLARLVDESPKRFFFVGDTLKALSVGVEILSLTNRNVFLLCGSAAALLKDAGRAMSGPSYRVFLDAFAVCGNIGDVSSRSEAQEVVGDLIGLGLGVTIAWTLSNISESTNGLIPTLVCYAILVTLHLSCTARAISLVELRTLNVQRADCVLTEFLATGSVPDVASVNRAERFVRGWRESDGGRRTVVGASVGEFAADASARAISIGGERGDLFAVVYDDGRAGLMIEEGASVKDVLTGTLQARKVVESVDLNERLDGKQLEIVLEESYRWALCNVERFVRALNHGGWSTERLMFVKDFRYHCDGAGRLEQSTVLKE